MIKEHLKFLLIDPAGWLLKSLEIAVLSFCLVVGMYDPASGQEFEITAHIEPESLTIGDRFLFVNSINAMDNFKIEPAPLGEQIGGAAVISQIYKLEDSLPGKISYACTLAVYQPGEIEVPSFVFNVTDSTGNIKGVIGKAVRTTVLSVLPPDTAGIEIADIKEPKKLRGPIWPYLLIPVIIAILIAAFIMIRKRLKNLIDLPEIPARPPWEIANEKLDRLRADKHIEFGRFKNYYMELSLIIREYIESRYNFPAVEYTTYELENTESLKLDAADLHNRLFEFFYRADLAKFAKLTPTADDAGSDLKFGYEFVSKTIPVETNATDANKNTAEVVN